MGSKTNLGKKIARGNDFQRLAEEQLEGSERPRYVPTAGSPCRFAYAQKSKKPKNRAQKRASTPRSAARPPKRVSPFTREERAAYGRMMHALDIPAAVARWDFGDTE